MIKKILIFFISLALVTIGVFALNNFNNVDNDVKENTESSKEIVEQEVIDEMLEDIDDNEEEIVIVDGKKTEIKNKNSDSKTNSISSKNNSKESETKNKKTENKNNDDEIEDTSEHHNDQPALEEGVHYTSGNEFHENEYGVNTWDYFSGTMSQSEAEQLGSDVNVYGYVYEETTTTTTTTTEFVPAES